MARKPKTVTETAEKPVEAAVEKPAKKEPEGSFFVYIGPNIPGVIQTISIYSGSRADALGKLEYATVKYPRIKALLVSGDTLATAQKEVTTPGTRLYTEYNRLVAELKK